MRDAGKDRTSLTENLEPRHGTNITAESTTAQFRPVWASAVITAEYGCETITTASSTRGGGAQTLAK